MGRASTWSSFAAVAAAVAAAGAITLPAPPAAAAFAGRVDVADVIRASAYGTGRVDGAGPAFHVAAGRWPAPHVEPPGCDGLGYAHRPLVAPRQALAVSVPSRTNRLDIVLAAEGGARDIVPTIGTHALPPLEAGTAWTHLSWALPEGVEGDQVLELTISEPSWGAARDKAAPGSAWARLHAVRFGRGPATGAGPQTFPVDADRGVLWFAAGDVITVPLLGIWNAESLALESRGVMTRGDAGDLVLRLEKVTAEGAATMLAELPAQLAIPWNAYIGSPGRAGESLRISAVGTATGLVGLVGPRITASGDIPPAPAIAQGPVVVIGVAGLLAGDIDRKDPRLTGASVVSDVTLPGGPDPVALTSFLTGRYPAGHGVLRVGDRLGSGVPTLAGAAASAGRHTILRAARVGPDVARGFADATAPADAKVLPHADPLLESLLRAIAKRGGGPALGVAVLADPSPPWIPRGDSWKAHWPEGEKPPWDARRGRQAMAEITAGTRTVDAATSRWIRALRRAKVDETLDAVARFVARLQEASVAPPVVMLVGLGGPRPEVAADPPDPGQLTAPLIVWGSGPLAGRGGGAALADVGATALAVAGVRPPLGLQGRDLRLGTARQWPRVAFASDQLTVDLAVRGDLALSVRRGQRTPTLYRRVEGSWQVADVPSDAGRLGVTLLERELAGWSGAGAAWRPEDHTPSPIVSPRDGHGPRCPR